MRMDQSQGETAAELVERLPEGELADLIFEFGEERGARKIARAIARQRQREPITTTRQLADLVTRALWQPGRWRIHPATRTFQALRIAVNQELTQLERLIPSAVSILSPGGRLAIISFHSLEDRVVKWSFLRETGRCTCKIEAKPLDPWAHKSRRGKDDEVEAERATAPNDSAIVCERCGARTRVAVLTRKPARPGAEEVAKNPRSRSALLRVCEKL